MRVLATNQHPLRCALLYVEQMLAPVLPPGDVVILDKVAGIKEAVQPLEPRQTIHVITDATGIPLALLPSGVDMCNSLVL